MTTPGAGRRHLAVGGLVAVLVAILHAPLLGLEWFPLDDDSIVLPLASGDIATDPLRTPEMGHPMPATLATYRLLWRVAGIDPTAWHAAGLVAAICGALALYAVALRLRLRPLWAAGAALLYAAHPVTVQADAWITAFKDAAPVPLLLGAAWVLAPDDHPRRRMALATALTLAAMAFKPTAAAFVLVLAWAPAVRGRWRDPIAGVCVGALAAAGAVAMTLSRAAQRDHFGALVELGAVERLKLMGHVFATQAARTLAVFDPLPRYTRP